jgi:putative oxidoreductase
MTAIETIWAPRVLSLLRIVAGLLFMAHGTQKFFGYPSAGPAHLAPLFIVAGTIELVGGFLVALGLFTRVAAFIMSGEMAVAYAMAYLPHGLRDLISHGEVAALFAFVFLYFVFAGPGPWSLDALRGAKRG